MYLGWFDEDMTIGVARGLQERERKRKEKGKKLLEEKV